MKSEYRKKQEAKERVFHALQQTKKRLGIGPARPLRGATPSPLVAKTWQRKANPAPTSDRIPGPAHANDFMHAHKWKRGVRENEATVKEIRRKASKIAPAYNKGALQYLPDD
jgi:hypothetical protein